jgi:hypothetical protein
MRRVSRLENEAILDRMADRLKARPKLLKRRRETVEHPFGSICTWIGWVLSGRATETRIGRTARALSTGR